MKKLLTTIAIVIAFFAVHAQIGVGPIELVKKKSGEFSNEVIRKLKASKTVFIYRETDDLKKLKKAIQEVWNITEISFLPYSKISMIDLEKTSIFSIRGVNTNIWNITSGMNYDNTHIYLSLWMIGENKKGKKIHESFCRIELHPTFIDYMTITRSNSEESLTYLYNEALLKNWNVGFIKNYLKNVNDLLTNESERWLYLSENENKEIKHLKTKTLYIPEYAMTEFNKFTGDESKKLDVGKILKPYPYKYKIIARDVLSEKIIESSEPFYYMVFIKSSTDKYITIYNSETGAIIYNKYKPSSYNLKASDFKDINKAINTIANRVERR